MYPPFKPARLDVSIVRRISMAFLAFWVNSSSPSGHGISEHIIHEAHADQTQKTQHSSHGVENKQTKISINILIFLGGTNLHTWWNHSEIMRK